VRQGVHDVVDADANAERGILLFSFLADKGRAVYETLTLRGRLEITREGRPEYRVEMFFLSPRGDCSGRGFVLTRVGLGFVNLRSPAQEARRSQKDLKSATIQTAPVMRKVKPNSDQFKWASG